MSHPSQFSFREISGANVHLLLQAVIRIFNKKPSANRNIVKAEGFILSRNNWENRRYFANVNFLTKLTWRCESLPRATKR